MNENAHRNLNEYSTPTPASVSSWAQIDQAAPALAATMQRYVEQVSVTLRPSTIRVIDRVLRAFAGFVTSLDIGSPNSAAEIERHHIEAYKRHLADQPGLKGPSLSSATIAQHLSALRMFFTRAIEWGWHDTPNRVLIYAGDYPPKDEPLPRAISDADVAALLQAARTDTDRPLTAVVVETLARTGLRVGEFTQLADDAIQTIDGTPWLRVPVGKLHNDRNIPLHPDVIDAISRYHEHTRPACGRLIVDENHQPLSRYQVQRVLNRSTKRADIAHVSPHQLRHTLATQAINRGMRIEAIAALLGHRSYDMTRRYAKVADQTVRDEYNNVTATLDHLYNNPQPQPSSSCADHHRLLANGWCTRPTQLGCQYESLCERCGFYNTNIDFRPTIAAQRDDARTKHQTDRHALFTSLLETLDRNPTHDPK